MSFLNNDKAQDLLYYPRCEKTKELKQKIQESKAAVVFLKLRNEGCKKREAIHFCSKTCCKVDTSKIIDGPANCRKLKPLQVKGLQVNGWELSCKCEYDMGKRYKQFSQLGIHSGEEEEKITKIIESKMKSNTHDYFYRIRVLEDYLKDIEKKCKIPAQNQNQLLIKIEQIMKEIKDFQNKPLYHVNHNGLKLYEIFQEYSKTKDDKFNNSYVNLFDSFSSLFNKNEFEGQIQFSKLQKRHSKKQNQNTPEKSDQKYIFTSQEQSSRNSLNSSKVQIQLNDENDEKEITNESISASQKTIQSGYSSPKIKNNLILRQKSKSKFKVSVSQNQTFDKKEQLNSTIASSSGKTSPLMRFFDQKIHKDSSTITEQDLLVNDTQDISIQIQQAPERKGSYENKLYPFLKQMDFNKKLDLLIDSAINDRQILPNISERCNKSLNSQILKVQGFKDKVEKKMNTSFCESPNSSKLKSQSYFFRPRINQTGSYTDKILSKNISPKFSNMYSTGFTSILEKKCF